MPVIFTWHGGERAAWRFLEFFTANIRNKNTRAAYARAVRLFCAWLDGRGVRDLAQVNPVLIGGYVEELGGMFSKPTVKQHLAAVRMLMDYMVTGGVLPFNPASSVRRPKHSMKRGKTPVISAAQARQLLDSVSVAFKDGTPDVVGLRDRAGRERIQARPDAPRLQWANIFRCRRSGRPVSYLGRHSHSG
ncbi:MAG: site-specific integrase [Kofleriaceae bacterium]